MNIAVVMAGGRGERMKMDFPKQFAEICGMPMIAYPLIAFSNHPEIDIIYTVCAPQWQEKVILTVEKYGIKKFGGFILPGETRRGSSENAVTYLAEKYSDGDTVLIHDAARPGISERIISENIKKVGETGACVTAVKCRDTMCVSREGILAESVERENTVMLQTPQTFKLGLIKKAHDFYGENVKNGKKVPEITDDTGLARFMGAKVATVRGEFYNMKVTEPGDIELLEGNIFANIKCKMSENN